MLPGGHRVDWLAGATYDRAVGFSLFTLQITHKIDADIDIERDYVTGSVLGAVPGAERTVLKDFTTGYHSRNGGGDSIHTDGDLPVLELPRVAEAPVPVDHRQERPLRVTGKPQALEETKESRRRPLSILGSAALVLASAATSIALGIPEFVRSGDVGLGMDSTYARFASLAALLALVAQLGLIALTLQGRQLPRLILMTILLLSITTGLTVHFGVLDAIADMEPPPGTEVAAVGLQIAALMLLSSNSSREYALAARQLRHDARAIADATQLF
jgi:hypothetical protein